MALLALLAAGALSCSVYRNDRCDLSPARYKQARLLYDMVGSMDLVKKTLSDEGWRRCEINEVEYRLTKELHLDTPYEPRAAATGEARSSQ